MNTWVRSSSLHELRCRNYRLQPKQRIMRDEITSGEDILGALLMGGRYISWWTGSALNIEEARLRLSIPSDWTPFTNYEVMFRENPQQHLNKKSKMRKCFTAPAKDCSLQALRVSSR